MANSEPFRNLGTAMMKAYNDDDFHPIPGPLDIQYTFPTCRSRSEEIMKIIRYIFVALAIYLTGVIAGIALETLTQDRN